MHLRRPRGNGRLEEPGNVDDRCPANRGVAVGESGTNSYARFDDHVRDRQESYENARRPTCGLAPNPVNVVREFNTTELQYQMGPGSSESGANGELVASLTNQCFLPARMNGMMVSGLGTNARGVGVSTGPIGPGGGTVVTAPTRPTTGRTRTPQQGDSKRSPPTPLTLLTGTPSNVTGCGACAETLAARLDEPLLLMEDRHAAGVFAEQDGGSDDSDDDMGGLPQGRAEEKKAAKIATNSGAIGETGVTGTSIGGDGQRHRAIWQQRGPRTSHVGLIICLHVGERYIRRLISCSVGTFCLRL